MQQKRPRSKSFRETIPAAGSESPRCISYRVAPANGFRKVPPPTQLDHDKLELGNDSWNHRVQLREAIEAMQQAVHSLVAKLDGQQGPTNDTDNNKNDDNNNNHNNNHNNNPNNTNTITTPTTTTTTKAVESLA